MRWSYLKAASVVGASLLAFSACSAFKVKPISPALEPFIAAAPKAQTVTLQQTLKVGLVWLKDEGSPTLPKRAEQASLETIRSHFSGEGKKLNITSVDSVTTADLPTLRQIGERRNVRYVLVLAPMVREVRVPARLRYGRGGYSLGTRTESFVTLDAVAIELDSGNALLAARGNARAMMEELDYGPIGPWYPRITRGVDLAGVGGFIYPAGEEFPAGEVRAVATKDAVAGLLADLDRIGRPTSS